MALLQQMLTIPSLSREESALAHYLVERARDLGLHAYVDEVGNFIASTHAELTDAPDAQPIVLLGHMDTVPGNIPVSLHDGLLYGRGAVDAKGPLAAFISATARVARQGNLQRPIVVVGAVEEEAATSRGARGVIERYRPIACMIGEPSGSRAVTIGYKGRLLVNGCVEGQLSHSAGPQQSSSEIAAGFWERVRRHAAEWNEQHAGTSVFASLQPSLRYIQNEQNGLDDRTRFTIGYRLPLNFDTAELRSQLTRWAYEDDMQISFTGEEIAYQSTRSTPLARSFIAALRASGVQPSFKVKTGTSDMNVVGPAWGTNIVAYGPGDSRLDHTPQEHIRISEYTHAIDVLEFVLRDGAQQRESTMSTTMRSLALLDSTLREGEQFARTYFSLEQRLQVARLLDALGVTFIEVPSPIASPETSDAIRAICALNLRAHIIPHVRCAEHDVLAALELPVYGLNMFFGTSNELRSYSHGRRIDQIKAEAVPLIRHVLSTGRYVRFSAEDAFRSDLVDLLTVFDAVVEAGVNRIGMPDSVGIATPRQVEQVVRLIADRYPGVGIEFHGHNDTGCAIANTIAAFEGGADCLDVTILGIGERNGIASLSGVISYLYVHYPELLTNYDLTGLVAVDQYVADCLNMPIPFTTPITSPQAFTHRAGVHTKAILHNPRAYEVINPSDFGIVRHIDIGSRITGRYAVGHRAATLGLELTNEELIQLTQSLKERAEQGALNDEEVNHLCLPGIKRKEIWYGNAS